MGSGAGCCLAYRGGSWEGSGSHKERPSSDFGLTLHGRPFQSVIANNTLVKVCVNAASPFLGFNTSLNCTTGMGGSIWLRDSPASPAASYGAFPLPPQPSSRGTPWL